MNLDLFRLDAINKNLSNQMKKELREAKSKEELDALVTSAEMELTDDALEAVSGGVVSPPIDCGTVSYGCQLHNPRQ